jgi:hypothetical protein
MTLQRFRALLILPAIVSTAAAGAASAPSWRDTPTARLEALALIQTLNAEILSSTSATLTLERWCREHQLAQPAIIVAHRTYNAVENPAAVPRQDLQVSAREIVQYRRVELSCGEHVLSIAQNWYVPSRLTAQMNRLLDNTQTPFGKVVRPLSPHRETIAVQLLWPPLPDGWELPQPQASPDVRPDGPLDMPAALFEHRAIVYTAAHQPIAEVDEIYQRDLLAFPEPHLP